MDARHDKTLVGLCLALILGPLSVIAVVVIVVSSLLAALEGDLAGQRDSLTFLMRVQNYQFSTIGRLGMIFASFDRPDATTFAAMQQIESKMDESYEMFSHKIKDYPDFDNLYQDLITNTMAGRKLLVQARDLLLRSDIPVTQKIRVLRPDFLAVVMSGNASIVTLFELEEQITNRFRTKLRTDQTILIATLVAMLLLNCLITIAVIVAFNIMVLGPLVRTRDILEGKNQETVAQANQEQETGFSLARLEEVLSTTFHQLSSLKTAESAVLQSTADLICSFDQHLHFNQIGLPARTLLGYEPDELMGSRVTRLISSTNPRDPEIFARALEDLESLVDEANIELVLKSKEGLDVYTSWSITYVAENEIFIAVIRDISRRKEFEKTIDLIASSLSHDMRTPLLSVLTSLQLMAQGGRGELSAQSAALVQSSLREANMLVELINDVLDWRKVQSRSSDLHLQNRYLAELIDELQADIEKWSGQKVLAQILDYEIEIACDVDLFKKAVKNLARYFRSIGKIKITGTASGDTAILKIRPEEYFTEDMLLDRLANPFALEFAQTIIQGAHDGAIKLETLANGKVSAIVIEIKGMRQDDFGGEP